MTPILSTDRGGLSPIRRDGFLLYECQQGTPAWLQCRAGCITASEFKKARSKVDTLTQQQALFVGALRAGKDSKEAMAIAGYKRAPTSDLIDRAVAGEKVGRFSDAALDYAFQKAIERICRVPLDENYQTWQMKRGQKLEPHARAAHEDVLERRRKPGASLEDSMVLPAGFMTTEDGVFGCSVDGLIGTVGGAEYKCLASAKRLRKVILDGDISDFLDQIHGCMWISGRDWWHFGLYVPALKPVGLEFQMVEVQRDDEYIDALEADLLEFSVEVNRYEDRLRTMGAKAIEEAAEEVHRSLEREHSEEMLELAEAF
jgi:hypothetical protein